MSNVYHVLTFFLLSHSSSDEHSWKRSKELLAEVARKGDESEDYLVPCLLIAAKDDLDPYPMAVRDSLGVYQFHCLSIIAQIVSYISLRSITCFTNLPFYFLISIERVLADNLCLFLCRLVKN